MKRVKLTHVLMFNAIFAALFLLSCNTTPEPEKNIGDRLVKQIWDNFLNNDTTATEKFMASGFQAVHDDGAIDKKQELKLVAGLNISNYTISDLNVTQSGNVIIATYRVAVEETIEGRRLSKNPAVRMSVFVEEGTQWQWLAHANLKSFDETVKDTLAVVHDSLK